MTYSLLEFIGGPAGSGKSTLLKTRKKVLMCAPTGISALNLGDNVRTINSTLNYFDSEDFKIKKEAGVIEKNLFKISAKYERIGLDEISFVESNQLDLLVLSILEHNKIVKESDKLSKKHNILGLTVLGDPAQLGPIKGLPFFKAKCWKLFNQIYLNTVRRQTNLEFINALSAIREGKVLEVVDWFEENIGFSKELDKDFTGSTFFSTNKEVDSFNSYKLAQLRTPEKKYSTERSGAQDRDWKTIPDYITVKPGMKVMILCNNFEEGYANGNLAILKECFPGGVLVELIRNKRQVLIEYKQLLNSVIQQRKNGEYYSKVIGSVTYLPIRQGDSSTIHKGQGLTLEEVQLDVRNDFMRKLTGSLYTGITRVVDYKGLKIVGSKDQFIKACYINPMYLSYIQELKSLNESNLLAA